MQSLKDATVILGLLLLLVSVKVAPLETVGDVIPSAQAAAAEEDAGTALAGFTSDLSVPVIRIEQPGTDQAARSEVRRIQVDSEVHDCESSIVHVHTLEFEGTGERIILRIDTEEGRAEVERLDPIEPALPAKTLEACKIG